MFPSVAQVIGLAGATLAFVLAIFVGGLIYIIYSCCFAARPGGNYAKAPTTEMTGVAGEDVKI